MITELSIIIPAYNCEKYIDDCLNSIYKQIKNYNIEIILINDGSKDNTLTIAKKFEKNANFKLIDLKENKGVSNARNLGITNATGKYMLFIDCDDLLADNSIKRIMKYIKNFDYDIVKFSYKYYFKKISYTKYKFKNIGLIKDKIEDYDKILETFIKSYDFNSSCGQIMKTNLAQKYRFDSNLTFAEDMIFNFEMYKEANSIYIDSKPIFYYRVNAESATRQLDINRIKNNAISCYNAYSNFYNADTKNEFTNQISDRIVYEVVSIFSKLYKYDKNSFDKVYDEFLVHIKSTNTIDKLLNKEIIKKECKLRIDKKENKLRKFAKRIINKCL